MIQRYQDARKYFIDLFGMEENASFHEVAQKVVDESNGKILFDGNDKKACAMFLLSVKDKFKR